MVVIFLKNNVTVTRVQARQVSPMSDDTPIRLTGDAYSALAYRLYRAASRGTSSPLSCSPRMPRSQRRPCPLRRFPSAVRWLLRTRVQRTALRSKSIRPPEGSAFRHGKRIGYKRAIISTISLSLYTSCITRLPVAVHKV